MPDSFRHLQAPDPHIQNGKTIMRDHPEVTQYFGPYHLSPVYVVGVVLLQLTVAFLLRDAGGLLIMLSAYGFGAFASHALFVLIHDATHNLVSKTSTTNRLFSILCNVGQGVPSAMSFRLFHLLHHARMGEYDCDGDLPSHWEARLVGHSTARKAVWLFLFSIVELLRPLHIKKGSIDRWTVWNVIAIIASNALIWHWSGVQGLAYILLSTFFGVGLHIVGGRWIQEHYIFKEGQETYSYYGPLNLVSFNVGYHYEHHDLVQVPWVHLPKIKALAPECYEHLHAHQSWGRVLTQFLFDKKLDLYSRMIR